MLFEDCSEPLTYVSERYDDVAAHAQEVDIVAVRSGDDSSGVDAALAEGGVLTGRVTSVHNGEEQQLVCVALYRSDARADGADSPVARDATGVVRDGITAGTTDGTHAPAAPVRRDRMASFLTRLLDRVQRDTTRGDPSRG